MSDVNESFLSFFAWLAYLPFFPLPGILVACVAALVAILGSLRYVRDEQTDSVWHQGWVWTSLAVVAVLVYVVLGFGFGGDGSIKAAAGLAAWWMGPIVIIFFSISEAALSRRRVLSAVKRPQADIGPAGS